MTQPIDMTPVSGSKETPHVCSELRWQRIAALLGVLLLLLVAGVVVSQLKGEQVPRPPWPRQARNADEQQLFHSLVPATAEEAAAMRLAAQRQGHDHLASSLPDELSGVFMATKDFRLAPGLTDEDSIVIGVPKGVKWLGGPRNHAAMVFADDSALVYSDGTVAGGNPLLALANGYVVYDPLCFGPSSGSAWAIKIPPPTPAWSGLPCSDSSLKPKEEWLAANKRHQLLTPQNADKFAPFTPSVGNPWPKDFSTYISQGDVWLWSGTGRRPVVLLQDGHHVLGGVVGDGIVVRYQGAKEWVQPYNVIADPLYYNPNFISPARPADGFPHDLCKEYLGPLVKKEHHNLCT